MKREILKEGGERTEKAIKKTDVFQLLGNIFFY